MPLFSPNTTSNCSYNTCSDNSVTISPVHGDFTDASDDINEPTSCHSTSSQCDDKPLVKNVEIEIIASDNIRINKGDKIVVTCDIYSKTTCAIHQNLVISKTSKKVHKTEQEEIVHIKAAPQSTY